ncbi:G2/M phase-specific E3 ubiquitin-protein ligase-like [Argopecten irradians]|uniref:G2/M phase-specific E3 ubiquitin-protein ligase-like n=1 Tax=Argopecten irradians TaxID=31199 RepID=UPI003716AEE8
MGNDQSVMELKTAAKQEQDKRKVSHGKFEEIMSLIRKEQTGKVVCLNVNRDCLFVMGTSQMKLKDSEFHPIEVTFLTDDHEEKNINLGGPNKEFFTLFLNEFRNQKLDMFEGKGGFLLPTHNKARADWFYYLGKAIVLSLLCGGPGFPYFPTFLVSYLRGAEFMHELSTLYVVNTLLVKHIEMVNTAGSQEEIDKVIGEDTERFTDYCGWPNERITMSNRMGYIQTLLQWHLIDRRKESLDEIKHGLRTLAFLDKTKECEEFDRFFLARDKRLTTAQYIKEKLLPQVEQLMTRNDAEKKTKSSTEELLRDLNDDEAAKLFQFITGLDDLPVHDFSMGVGFNRSDPTAQLPQATTCLQYLHLPLGNKSKMELYSSFNKALTLGKIGFSE